LTKLKVKLAGAQVVVAAAHCSFRAH